MICMLDHWVTRKFVCTLNTYTPLVLAFSFAPIPFHYIMKVIRNVAWRLTSWWGISGEDKLPSCSLNVINTCFTLAAAKFEMTNYCKTVCLVHSEGEEKLCKCKGETNQKLRLLTLNFINKQGRQCIIALLGCLQKQNVNCFQRVWKLLEVCAQVHKNIAQSLVF